MSSPDMLKVEREIMVLLQNTLELIIINIIKELVKFKWRVRWVINHIIQVRKYICSMSFI